MHMNDLPAACPLMQVIDILGDDQNLTRKHPFKTRQSVMCSIGFGIQSVGPARIIEIMNQLGIGGKSLRGGDLGQIIARPEPVLVAEGAKPRFSRDPCPRQNNDPLHFLPLLLPSRLPRAKTSA